VGGGGGLFFVGGGGGLVLLFLFFEGCLGCLFVCGGATGTLRETGLGRGVATGQKEVGKSERLEAEKTNIWNRNKK